MLDERARAQVGHRLRAQAQHRLAPGIGAGPPQRVGDADAHHGEAAAPRRDEPQQLEAVRREALAHHGDVEAALVEQRLRILQAVREAQLVAGEQRADAGVHGRHVRDQNAEAGWWVHRSLSHAGTCRRGRSL